MDIWGKSVQAEETAHKVSCVLRWECEAYAERARRPMGEGASGGDGSQS